MDILDIYRAGSIFVTIKPDDNTVQSKTIMGENEVRLQFRTSNYINFSINDYCTVFGEKYILNRTPVVQKISTYLYQYTLLMEAEGFELARAQYLFLDPNNNFTSSDFSLMGNAETFANLILTNVARVGGDWQKGDIISTEYKNLTFSKENCYNVLGRIAEAFNTEFWVIGKTIHITARNRDTGFTFKHGRAKGLYQITRQSLNNSDIATRLYAFGSDRNLPPDYGYPRLVMPFGDPILISNLAWTFGVLFTQITFTWTAPLDDSIDAVNIEYRSKSSTGAWTVDSGSKEGPRTIIVPLFTDVRFRSMTSGISVGLSPIISIPPLSGGPIFNNRIAYVERNVDQYGVIEATEFFDDIFPHRTGIVSSVDAANFYKFIDADIDFDVIAQLLPGLDAKITFNTGQLAGYTFKISAFDFSIKQFTLLKNEDETALDIPSASLKPAIGDQYVLTDIQMPDSYVTAAEQALYAAAIAFITTASIPQVSYQVSVDPVFLKNLNKTFNIADLVWIVDEAMEIQRKIRIVNTTRSLLNEFQYDLQLSDIVSATTFERIINTQLSTDRDVNGVQNQINNNSILNNRIIGPFYNLQIPETSDLTGFSPLVIENSTGKICKQI